MSDTIKVEVGYGTEQDLEQFGLVFYFDSYKAASKFVSFVEEHSNCDMARIIQVLKFKE